MCVCHINTSTYMSASYCKNKIQSTVFSSQKETLDYISLSLTFLVLGDLGHVDFSNMSYTSFFLFTVQYGLLLCDLHRIPIFVLLTVTWYSTLSVDSCLFLALGIFSWLIPYYFSGSS